MKMIQRFMSYSFLFIVPEYQMTKDNQFSSKYVFDQLKEWYFSIRVKSNITFSFVGNC